MSRVPPVAIDSHVDLQQVVTHRAITVKSVVELRRAWFIGCACVTPFMLGCNGQQVRYAPVSGTVTIDGKPVGSAEIVLSCDEISVDGPRPTTRGVTDETGRFVLRSLTPEKNIVDGAIVGRHHVFLKTRIVDQDDHGRDRVTREELLGQEYTNGEKLTVDVPPEGIDELRFDLDGK